MNRRLLKRLLTPQEFAEVEHTEKDCPLLQILKRLLKDKEENIETLKIKEDEFKCGSAILKFEEGLEKPLTVIGFTSSDKPRFKFSLKDHHEESVLELFIERKIQEDLHDHARKLGWNFLDNEATEEECIDFMAFWWMMFKNMRRKRLQKETLRGFAKYMDSKKDS